MIRKDFMAIGCIYCILIAFCITNIYLNIIQIDYLLITRIAVCACGVYAIAVVAAGLPSSKYSVFLQLMTILLSARLLGLGGTILCGFLTSEDLFRLPFGNIGSFIFAFSAAGLFKFLLHGIAPEKRKAFSPLYLIPVLFFAVPYIADRFYPAESLVFTIYSYIYTAASASAVLCCLIVIKRKRDYTRIAVPVIVAACSDMLVYLYFTPIAEFLPEGVNFLLIPVYSMLIAEAALKLTRGE